MAEIQIVKNAVAPNTPPTGSVTVYPKSDGILYVKDDTGVETPAVSLGLVHYQVMARIALGC
jgi:hypothetical protein